MLLTSEIFTASAETIHADGEHLFWPSNNLESLTESIAEFGQSAPVLVMEGARGLSLVAGRARLAVLTALGRPVLARMVAPESGRPDAVALGLLYLADNVQRPLDDGMRFQALGYFAPRMDRETLRTDILPRLGVKAQSKDAKLFLAWLDLPGAWRALLMEGNVPLAAGSVLERMTEADREAALPLFTGFSWSRSNAVNVLTWLFETGRMTGAPLTEVMERAGMTEILAQGLSPKDAIARLSATARETRFPELSRLQAAFAEAASALTAGSRWRLTQPDNFETGGAELTVKIKDADQLARAVQELGSMAESNGWAEIWKLGSADD